MPATTTQNRRAIVVSVPDATVQLLEIVADARDIELGEMASILLQQAVLDTAAWDRRQSSIVMGETDLGRAS